MQHGIEQHRGVSVGKDEAVAIWPMRVLGVMPKITVPHNIGERRQGHGSSRMAAICFLHSVHGERANGIDRQQLKLLVGFLTRGWTTFGFNASVRFEDGGG